MQKNLLVNRIKNKAWENIVFIFYAQLSILSLICVDLKNKSNFVIF